MPSSVVAEYEYNSGTATLQITYVSGKVCDYLNVPDEIYLEMKDASSKGTFLNERIKGTYKFRKIK